MLVRLCFVLSVVLLCGCDDIPPLGESKPEPTVNLDMLGDEFQMAPPVGLQELEERRLGRFLWEKCLPPYGGTGEKPVLPTKTP